MNKLAVLAMTILLICGGILWFLASGSLNTFIKSRLEAIGSATTEQTVTVKNVDFQLTKGKATIKGLVIDDPKGYQQKNAFTLGTISLDIDVTSLAKDPIIVEDFTIKNVQAFVELNKSGRANYQNIIAAINKKMPRSQPPRSKDERQTEPNVRIEKITLTDIGLTLDLRQLGNKLYQEKLPNINLGSIGGNAGLPVSVLGVKITEKIIKTLWQQAKKVQTEKLKAAARKKLKEKAKALTHQYEDKIKKKLGSLLDKFKN